MYVISIIFKRNIYIQLCSIFDCGKRLHLVINIRHDKFRSSCRRIVLIAIQNEGSSRMTDEAYDLLERFGANNILRKKYRSSYALLGWSGPGTLDAVTQVTYDYIEDIDRFLFSSSLHSFITQHTWSDERG